MKRITCCFLIFLLTACVERYDSEFQNEKLEQIFIISLDRTPERFEFVKKQLEKYGISFDRFSAVDGYKLEFQNVKTKTFLTSKQKRDAFKKGVKLDVFLDGKILMRLDTTHSRFSMGEIGCACSHREIWKKIAVGEYKKAIILEDDVVLSEDFKCRLKNYINNLPADWDIAFLGVGRRHNKYGYFVSVGDIFRDLDNVEGNPLVAKIQPTNLVYGLYGYMINSDGAKKLLKLTDESDYPVDDIVFQQGGIDTGRIKGYVSMEKLLEPKLTDSEIKKMGRSY